MAESAVLTRRLATIVIIDVVGYSSRVEIDLNHSLGEVAAFAERVVQSADPCGGRLFKTTGDGFLLEFPTVSGALEFTDVLRTAAMIPIRIGVHVGEVAVTSENDLLGHSVNVAARLEAIASVNGVLVSSDVVRAVQGTFGRRFTRRGELQLEKMQETLTVYSFEPLGTRRPRLALPHPRSLARRWPWAAAVVFVAIAIAAVLFGREGLPWIGPHRPLIAILGPEVLAGTAGAHEVADAIVHDVVDDTAASGLDAVSKSTSAWGSAHARLTTGGYLRQTGDAVDVTIEIADSKEHVMLWSGKFLGTIEGAKSLASQVATKTTDMLVCGSSAYAKGAVLTTEARRLWFRICDYRRQQDGNLATRDAAQTLVKLAPNFSGGFISLAMGSAQSIGSLPPEQADATRREAQTAATRALKLSPHDGLAYIALSALAPPHQWAQREAWLLKGLAQDPNGSSLFNYECDLLRSVGRMNDAYLHCSRAVELDPLSPAKREDLVHILIQQGRTTEAYEMNDEAQKYWPHYPWLRDVALRRALDSGNAAEAQEILDDPMRRPPGMSDTALAIWRRFPGAVRGSASEKASVGADLRAAMAANKSDEGLAIHGLLVLGQDDVLFDELMREGEKAGDFSSQVLGPDGVVFRRRAGFMRLASTMGLTSYWLSTGKWPDFCAVPGLSYDCRTEAERAIRPQ